MTTRTREAALKLVEQRDIIKVDPMNEAHAVRLFEKKLERQGDSGDIAELVAELDFMPLAIVQAAAYITERAPRCSVQQYLEEFRKNDGRKTRLLNHDAGQPLRDWEAKNSILTTWEITFSHILKTRPPAAHLLSLMSFFDRQGIPEAVLRRTAAEEVLDVDGNNPLEDGTSDSTEDDGFEDNILTLRNYSFVSAIDRTTFEMHGLVQLATRNWLCANGQLERWKRLFIRNLSAEFPSGEHENWEMCQVLFSHAKSAVAQQPNDPESLLEWASLLHNAALYSWRKGNVGDAQKMSKGQ
jgi:hypothetical protein